MGVIVETTTIPGELQRVWDAMVDFESRPRWEPRVKEASILGGKPLREGSCIDLRVDRGRVIVTVAAIEPPTRIVLLVKGPGFRVTHGYELSPEQGGTKLVMRGDYRGLIGRLVVRLKRGSVQRDLIDELTAIKRSVEAGS